MDEPSSHPLRTKVGEAVGAASTCWVGGTGPLVFDSQRAVEIINGLLSDVSEYETNLVKASTQAVARAHAYLILLTEARAMLREVARGTALAATSLEAKDWVERFQAVLEYPPLIDLDQLVLDTDGA